MRHIREQDRIKIETDKVNLASPADWRDHTKSRLEARVRNLSASRAGYPVSDPEYVRLGGKIESLNEVLEYFAEPRMIVQVLP